MLVRQMAVMVALVLPRLFQELLQPMLVAEEEVIKVALLVLVVLVVGQMLLILHPLQLPQLSIQAEVVAVLDTVLDIQLLAQAVAVS